MISKENFTRVLLVIHLKVLLESSWNLLDTVKGHKYSSLSKKMLEIFTPVVHTINRKTLMRGARLVNKARAEKNSKNRNKQTSDQEHEKKKEEIRAGFFLDFVYSVIRH